MQISLCLEHLFPDRILKYRNAFNYESLVATWHKDDPAIPTEDEIIAAWPAAEIKQEAQRLLIKLEEEITPRRIRDSVLTEDGKKWLEDQEKLIAVERAKL